MGNHEYNPHGTMGANLPRFPTVAGRISSSLDVNHISLSAHNLCVIAERITDGEVVERRRFDVTENIEHIEMTPELPAIERRWIQYTTNPLVPHGTWRIFLADHEGCPVYLGDPSLYYFESSPNARDKTDAHFVVKTALSNWLDSHQAVKNAIQWLEPGRSWLTYDEWSDEWKCELLMAIVLQKEGYSLTRDGPLTPLLEEGRVVHDYDQARTLHFSAVAQTLLTEILGSVPWVLEDLSGEELEILFEPYCDKSSYTCMPEGYVHASTTSAEDCSRVGIRPIMLQPAPGPVAWRFLVLNEIIGATRRDTIIRLLKWGRHHLRHFVTPPEEATASSSEEFYWGHDRGALAIRIMEGTEPASPISSGDMYPYANWTKGCTTTTYLLKQLLGIVHIPVSIARPGLPSHHAPHFVHERLYLAHADDIYDVAVETDYPAEELFVTPTQYGLWFETEETAVKGVGIKLKQLRVEHLGLSLLASHCYDKERGRNHAESEVLERSSEAYSLQELEDMNLWDRMDEKIKVLRGCDAVKKVLTERHEQFWNIERSPLLG